MFKNVATKVKLFAFTTTTGAPKTGDAANLTAYVSKDNGAVTVLADTSATEMDATNAPGWYLFDVAQTETNADSLLFTGKSATANVSVVGQSIYTTPNLFTSLSIDASGLVDALNTAAIKAVTDKLNSMLVAPGGSPTDYRFLPEAVQGVWDAVLAEHLTAGTTGAKLNSTSTLDAAGIRSAVGLASANLDTQLVTIDDYVDTEVAAIKQVTDKLHSMVEAATGSPNEFRFTQDALRHVRTELAAELSRIDVAISTRLASASYTAPDNATITAIAGYVDTEVAAILAAVDTEIGSIKEVTDKLNTTLEAASGSPNEFRFSLDALRQIPALVWNAERTNYSIAGSFGQYVPADTVLIEGVDATNQIRDSANAADVLQRLITLLEPAAGSPNEYRLSKDALRNLESLVWDTKVSDHLAAGTAGAALNAASSAGDPWATSIPGAYGAGTAGFIVGTNLDTTVSSRATQSSVNTLSGYVDTEVSSIKEVTDKLNSMVTATPGSPTDYRFLAEAVERVWDVRLIEHLTAGSTGNALNAAGSAGDPWATSLPGAYGAGTAGFIVGTNLDTTVSSRSSQSSVDTVAGYVDTEVAAIKQVTDKLHSMLEAAAGSPNEFRFTQDALRHVRTELSAELAFLDAAVSTRLASASYTAPDNATITAIASYVDTEVAAIKQVTDKLHSALEAATGSPNEFRFTQDALRNIRTELAAELARIDVAISTRLASAGYTAPDNASVAAIKVVTDKLHTTLEIGAGSPGEYRFSADALVQAPRLSDSALTNITTKLDTIAGYVDTEVAAIKLVTDKLNSMLTAPAGSPTDYRFLPEAIQGVWDVSMSEHLTAGTTGASLSAAGAAGDPWSIALPGAYGAGTAGNIVGTFLDATVSSRATQTSVNTLSGYVDTEVAAIKEVTDKLATTFEAASGSPNEVLFTQDALRYVPSMVRGELAVELARIDANVSSRATQTSVDAIDDYVDTEVAAIKAKTDNLPANPAAVSDIPTAAVVADAVWDESNAAHVGAGSTGLALLNTDLRGDRTVIRGTVGIGSSTTSIVTSAFDPAGAAADQFKGRIVVFDNDTATATLRGQATDIQNNTNAATPTLTVTTLTHAPSSGDTFSVV